MKKSALLLVLQNCLSPFNYRDNLFQVKRKSRITEKKDKEWPIDQNYIVPPSSGKIVKLDQVLIISPPVGLEFGYVPIVMKQELDY